MNIVENIDQLFEKRLSDLYCTEDYFIKIFPRNNQTEAGVEISQNLEILIGEIEDRLSNPETGEAKIKTILRAVRQIVIYEIAGCITLYIYADELQYSVIPTLFEKTLEELPPPI